MMRVLFIQWWCVFIHSEMTENLSVRYGRFPRRRREGERCLFENMIYIKEYY
jgi:hypothetical protein